MLIERRVGRVDRSLFKDAENKDNIGRSQKSNNALLQLPMIRTDMKFQNKEMQLESIIV